MRKILFTILSAATLTVSAQTGVYQVGNSDFENWESVSYKKTTGEEPLHWNSFLTGTGSMKSFAGYNQLEKSTDAHSGTYSAKIYSRAVKIGFWTVATAQGNLTTGCVNMGSSTASDPGNTAAGKDTTELKGNFNYTNPNDNSAKQPFTGKPDAMRVYVKFTGSKKKAKATTVLHTEGYYQDPLGNSNYVNAQLVATASKTDITAQNSWQELTIPFVYANKELTPAYALVSFATSATPGDGVEGDAMLIDDLSYIYNSQLASVTYDGASVSVATAMNVAKAYDPSKIALTANGVGASIEKSYNATTGLLTITVKGNDVSVNPTNVHTYTIQFAAASNAPTLTSISVGGQPLTDFGLTFNPATTTYTLPIAYHRGIVVEGVAGANSTLMRDEEFYETYALTENAFYNDHNKTIELRVKNSNGDERDYVLRFTDAVSATESGDYPGALSVVLSTTAEGSTTTNASPLANEQISLTKNSNGTYNIYLPNFNFSGLPVGNIYVPNVPLAGSAMNANRTIRLTSSEEMAVGAGLGHLPVVLKLNLINSAHKRLEGAIDIITTGTTNPILTRFSAIHVDCVPFTVNENAPQNSDDKDNKAYANQTLWGYISKASTKFIHLNEAAVGKPMTYVNMSVATLADDVTAEDLKQGAVAANNTLYYLPATSTLTGKNLIVNGYTTEFALNDAVAIEVPTQFSADKASYDRNFTTTGYTTFALPVTTAASTLNGTVYELKGFNAARSAFDFAPVANIEANKPYLFEANNAALFANGAVTVAVANADTEVKTHTGVGVEQEGNYGETKVLASDATNTYYGYSNGQFVKATTGTLNRYRTAFRVANTAAGARSFAISINGTVTGIITLDNGTMGVEKGQIFDLQGRRVLTTQKGQTYIINGKKVIL